MRVRRVVGLLILMSAAGVAAQVRAPRPPAARPPAPRLADGTPNLGAIVPNKGYWAPAQYQDYTAIADPKDIPFQPWARAVADQRKASGSTLDPNGLCLPPSGPRLMTTPYPMEILQMPAQKRIVMIYEGAAHIWRNIYMDGRPHPPLDTLAPTWLGHSVGHWEGDTLVIDVVGFNEGSWLDLTGKPHTDLLHLVERFTRTDLFTLHYEAAIEDPGAYTRPWTIAFDVAWDPEGEIQEYICQENNRWMNKLGADR
jgi:hypothetical protein